LRQLTADLLLVGKREAAPGAAVARGHEAVAGSGTGWGCILLGLCPAACHWSLCQQHPEQGCK